MAVSTKNSEPPLKRVKNVIIRNLLGAPDDDQWPRLPEHESEILKAELKKNLVHLKVPEVKRPWRDMNKLSKDKRKALLKEFEDNLPPDILKLKDAARQMRSWLFLGINAVSRAIESDSISCCLLAEDVTPTNLVKHVVQLATHAKVPVFLVGGFKKYCKDVMGFPCIALGFAKLCPPDVEPHAFASVCRLIEKFHQDWEKSGRHPSKLKDAPDANKPEGAPLAGMQHITTQTTTIVPTADAQESCNILSSASSFHLMRRSKFERAFVPDEQVERRVGPEQTTEKPEKQSFIEQNLMKYKLPSVLRVRNNPFKLKRKKKKKKTA